MSSEPTVIAIDGPSASGKSSTSRAVADALGYNYADTGSMYRAFAWKVHQEKIDPSDEAAVLSLVKRMRYECDFVDNPNGPRSLRSRLDGVDPGKAIREPEIEHYASLIATISGVRSWLVEKQRQLAVLGDLVIEGRDIGTVVFPNTPFKFFLDADRDIRAKRRTADHTAIGVQSQVSQVSDAMADRDKRDSTRLAAPLKPAPDAFRIDTTNHTIQDTVDLILKHIRSKHVTGGLG
jgi:cytidylate kinase